MMSYRVIGLMSGTSMDGLDLADVQFELNDQGEWLYVLKGVESIGYTEQERAELLGAYHLSAEKLAAFSAALGRYYGTKVNAYLARNKIPSQRIDFIASHGQTIFHQPEQGYTLQVGNGPELAVTTGIPTVVDFRVQDVALGGNGAPLIPVPDFLLFGQLADSFMNLGGFSNLSFQHNGRVKSYDICPVNIVVNDLMKECGANFDRNGDFGRGGVIDATLLQKLNDLDYYQRPFPKSLGWEWVRDVVFPLFNRGEALQDEVRTYYEHCAMQIAASLKQVAARKVLVTGGGAKNSFLIERIRALSTSEILLPSEQLIDFKEAIGFAFLGVLRWRREVNVWASVTGAKKDSSSGHVIFP